jgi:TonB-dependent starch-binding outer membrane protein SusC
MRKSLLLVVGALILLSATSYAQDRAVSGKVTSQEDGSPLPGVNVVVKGTSTGTVTDNDGGYTINISSNDNVLVFSFIGLVTQEVMVGAKSVVDVSMSNDIKQLSEVVVVGYGTQLKQDLTGNIASVKGEVLQNIPVPTFEQALQGRAAGVHIEAGNGKLGQGVKVRIRGSSSVSADNQPLYVVDGIPITSQSQSTTSAETNPLTDINSSDIESIQILKDASASAIYGSRAANGVVLITTKRGKTGKTSFTLGYQTGVSEATNKREWLNTAEYVELFREARNNSATLGIPTSSVTSLENRFTRYAAGNRAAWEDPSSPAYTDTYWEDEVFRTGGINQIDLSASGGNDKTKFFVSGTWSDQKGILVRNDLERISGRLNLDHQASEKLAIGINFSLTKTDNFRLSDDNAFSTPMQIVALAPMTPVIDPRTGLVSGALDLSTGIPNGNFPTYYNPLIDVFYNDRLTRVYRNLGTFYASYDITPQFKFRSELGYDLLNQHEERYFARESFRNTGQINGSGTDTWTQIFNYTTNNFIQYTQSFNEVHNLEAVAGLSYQQSNRDAASLSGVQFPSNSFRELSTAATITGATSNETAFSFLSYFARANYKFNNKYLIGLSGRVDGSSRFGEGNKFGFFPAASLGWVITEESFLSNNSVVEFLKLRASYGLTGNAEIGNFAALGLYTGGSGYAGVGGQSPLQLPNDNLKWEQTTQTDIGIDFGLFNGRITGEVDYYIKNTSDLLLNVNLPGSSGYSTQIQNIGELENKGFEVVINSENIVGNFRWSTNVNFSRNRNKITNLNGQVIEGSFLSRAVEGEPIGIFFGPEYAGVDASNGDAVYFLNRTPSQDELNGGDAYLLENQFGDQYITNNVNIAELVKVGDPNPDFIAGMTNNFSFKGIDLSILFQGVFGYDVYNGGGKFMTANGDFFDNQTRDQLDRWQNPGDITNVPQARLFGANGTAESSRYVYEAGFVRLKTVTLGYNIPTSITNRLKLSRARVYASAQNLLTFTNYEGWDPEVNADTYASNINQGIDFYSAPQARTITFGVTLGF